MTRRTIIILLSLSLLLCLAVPLSLDLYNHSTPIPEPKWDHSSENVVLMIDHFRGEVDCDYLPPLEIKGNGQVLRTYNSNGERHVLETTLSEQDLERIINSFIQADFFEEDTRYDPVLPMGEFLRLSLDNKITHWVPLDENKAVKILAEQLIDEIEGKSQKFIPSEGTITVYQVDYELGSNEVSQSWPDEIFGYSLDQVIGEKKVLQDQELVFAWNVRNSASQIVESKGQLYWFCIIHE